MNDREIITTRLLNAPRELVFRVWTDPNHVAQWWGPNGFTTTTQEMNVKPGGVWRFIMHGPDGTDYPNEIVYEEIVPPELLVYTHGSGQADKSEDFKVTVTFQEQGTKTYLTLRALFATAAVRQMHVDKFHAIEGAIQTVNRLEDYLGQVAAPIAAPTDQPLVIVRTFNAPREIVFKAWTEPEHLKHWWGPKGFHWVSATSDLRPNGVLHYHLRSPEGHDMWGKLVYREITPPERLVFVTSFSDPAGNTVRSSFIADWPLEVQNTLTFTEQEGKTTLHMVGIPIHATDAERQTFQAAQRSVQGGFKGTLDQLDAYLGTL